MATFSTGCGPSSTMGFCMGGPFTVRTAAAAPARVGAIASFHGGGLVTDEPTSPHLLFATLKAVPKLPRQRAP